MLPERLIEMNNIKITVGTKTDEGGCIGLRNVRLREKILTKLFGHHKNMVMLIPTDDVDAIHIKEERLGGESDETVRD